MKYQVDVNKILTNKQNRIEDPPIDNISNDESLLEALLAKNEKDRNTIVCESLSVYNDNITENELQDYFDFQSKTYKMFYDENDITMEQFIEFIQGCIKYEYIDDVMEAAGRQTTRKVEKGLRKVNHKVNGHRNTLGKNLQRIDDKASDIANRKLDDIINTGRDIKRDKLLQGRPQIKISRFIKQGITALGAATGAAALFGPAVAAVIVAIGILCRKDLLKKTEKREKQRILLELETDLKITREKIEDAKAENDRKKKYQLMRIESTLEKEITRIKYGLRYY